jgi:hypothetical protein
MVAAIPRSGPLPGGDFLENEVTVDALPDLTAEISRSFIGVGYWLQSPCCLATLGL